MIVWTDGKERVDNANLEKDVPRLVSLSGFPIEVTKLEEEINSEKIVTKVRQAGFEVYDTTFAIYNEAKWGKPRLIDNSDIVRGYPMYTGDTPEDKLNDVRHTWSAIIKVGEKLMDVVRDKIPHIFNDEDDDVGKLSIQRTEYYGRHIDSPFDDYALRDPHDGYLKVLDFVLDDIVEHIKREGFNRDQFFMSTIDAQETAPGGPTFAGTDIVKINNGLETVEINYHGKRLLALQAQPVPDYSRPPGSYLDLIYEWGYSLGLPQGAMAWSSYLSFRSGAKKKAQPVFVDKGGMFAATHEASSLHCNMRKVYPGAFGRNLTVTPGVYCLKRWRQSRLGLWHTPDRVDNWIREINKTPGNHSYMCDFSNFDRTQKNFYLWYVADYLYRKTGIWEFGLLAAFYKNTGIIYPSFYTGDPTAVTFMHGPITLLSGWLETSDMGTVLSLAAQLFSLSGQFPDICSKWKSGKFVIAVQSDDVLFQTPSALNEEMFVQRMDDAGFKAKLLPGHTFLKLMIPIGSQKDRPITRLISRILQQTFGNEDKYDTPLKPDAIIRLGLMARCENIHGHPAWPYMKKDILDLLDRPIYHKVLDKIGQGVDALDDADKLEILKYSETKAGEDWLSQLMVLSTSVPSAAETLAMLKKSINLDTDALQIERTKMRKSYLDALFSKGNAKTTDMLYAICKWVQ